MENRVKIILQVRTLQAERYQWRIKLVEEYLYLRALRTSIRLIAHKIQTAAEAPSKEPTKE